MNNRFGVGKENQKSQESYLNVKERYNGITREGCKND